MKLNRKRIIILAAIFLTCYGGTYVTLRCTGVITRYENRGREEGNEVKARVSEWNDLIPILGKAEKLVMNSLNLIFYPLTRIEEIAYNLNTKEPTSRSYQHLSRYRRDSPHRSKKEMKSALIFLCLLVLVGCQSSKRSEEAKTAAQVESLVDMLFNGNERAKADTWEKLDRLCRSNEPAMSTLVKEMNKPKYISNEKDLDKLGDSKWKKRMLLAALIDSFTEEDFHTNTSAHGWNPDYSFDLINQWWLKIHTNKIGPAGSGQPM